MTPLINVTIWQYIEYWPICVGFNTVLLESELFCERSDCNTRDERQQYAAIPSLKQDPKSREKTIFSVLGYGKYSRKEFQIDAFSYLPPSCLGRACYISSQSLHTFYKESTNVVTLHVADWVFLLCFLSRCRPTPPPLNGSVVSRNQPIPPRLYLQIESRSRLARLISIASCCFLFLSLDQVVDLSYENVKRKRMAEWDEMRWVSWVSHINWCPTEPSRG